VAERMEEDVGEESSNCKVLLQQGGGVGCMPTCMPFLLYTSIRARAKIDGRHKPPMTLTIDGGVYSIYRLDFNTQPDLLRILR
jgi:hypothetical protein